MRNWLSPPIFSGDEEANQKAEVTHAVIWSVIAFLICLSIGNLIWTKIPVEIFLFLLIGILVCFGQLFLLHRGYINIAGVGLIIFSMVLITVGIIRLGDIRSPNTTLYILLVVASGLLFNLRGVITTAFFSSLIILGLFEAKKLGLLPMEHSPLGFQQWFAYSIFLGLSGSFVLFSTRATQKALRRADKELLERKRTEIALQESLAIQHAFFEKARDTILIADPDSGKILSANSQAEILFECRRDQIIGLHQSQLHPVESQEKIAAYFKEIVAGELERVEVNIQTRRGRIIPVEINASRIRQPNGKDVIHGLFRDVTDRKKAEEARRSSEARLRALFEQTHDAVFLLDLMGNHLAANQRAAIMIGYSQKELAELSYNETSAELEKSQCVLNLLLMGEKVPTYERWFKKKDGSLIPVEINVELVKDENGIPLHIQSVVRDISERKQAEEKLLQSELKYRIVADNTYDWEYWQAPNDQFQYISPSCHRITGHTAAEFVQDPGLLEHIIYMFDLPKYRIHRETVTKNMESGELEFRIVLADGSLRWISHVCQPVFDHCNQYLGIRCSNRDITSKKDMENAILQAYEDLQVQVNEVYKLQAELQIQALHDPLTGLHNRRYLDQMMELELERAAHQNKKLSVLILDIDFFKVINDTYGHPAGDKVLCDLAKIVQGFARKTDVCCRYGGEEFILVLPDASAEDTLSRANKLRELCKKTGFSYKDIPIKLTISAGVAEYPNHGLNAIDILISADKALYYSKQNGRNQVTLAPTPARQSAKLLL